MMKGRERGDPLSKGGLQPLELRMMKEWERGDPLSKGRAPAPRATYDEGEGAKQRERGL
jgi:hypothetical protein